MQINNQRCKLLYHGLPEALERVQESRQLDCLAAILSLQQINSVCS